MAVDTHLLRALATEAPIELALIKLELASIEPAVVCFTAKQALAATFATKAVTLAKEGATKLKASAIEVEATEEGQLLS